MYVKEPLPPHARVVYNYKRNTFVPLKTKTVYVTLTNLKSVLLLRDSPEADIQITNESCSKTNYLIERIVNVVITMFLCYLFIFFFYVTMIYVAGIPENIAGDDNGDFDEMAEEEETNLMKIENNELGMMETIEEEAFEDEFQNAEDEMGEMNEMDEINEMEENQQLSDTLGSQSSEFNEVPRVKKEKSEETIYSLPIQKLCAVLKLKNDFNFFNRFTQTKAIYLRVRLDYSRLFLTFL